MSEYILSCCSTVDLSADYMGERNIHYLPFHFELDEVDSSEGVLPENEVRGNAPNFSDKCYRV